MHSTAQTAHVGLEIINETAYTGEAWIRQRKEPMWALKSSTKTQSLQNQNSTAQTAPPASEIITESASTGDTWIRQRRQPLRPQKSSTQLLPRVTHGFDSAKSPCGL